MEQPFEVKYHGENTTYVLAVYRSYDDQGQRSRYTIVLDEVSLGDLAKAEDAWVWISGGKEGPNHGGINFNEHSAQEIGKAIEAHLSEADGEDSGAG